VQFAQIMRDPLSGSGIPASTYGDSGGLNPIFRKPNRANVFSKNPPMPPAPATTS
jgi:hypothetical protein